MASMTLDELVSQLQKAYGAGLRSVVLYGSAASGDHIPKRSDQNVLVIVDQLDVDALMRAGVVARAWGEGGNPPPMTLTTHEWHNSADIFPMEYADILDRHRVLFGTPPFDGVSVDRHDLRLQLEHQAMGKLLQLRQGILAAGGDRKRLIDLLAASVSTFMVIFRSVLRFHGEEVEPGHEAVAKRVGALTGLAAEPFVTVVRHARGEMKVREQDVPTVLAGYLAGAQQLVAHIDQMDSQ